MSDPAADPRRRRWALILVVALVVIILAALFGPRVLRPGPPTTEVRGIVGSESIPFLSDPQVQDELSARGYTLRAPEPSGSFEIPARGDLDAFDFALSSSDPAGQELARSRHVPATASPFSSPMVVVTYPAVVDVLTRAGVVGPGPDGAPVLDVATLARLVERGTRWGDLPGNTVPARTRAVLLSTTDPTDSNSASMFLALASYALNGNSVVTTGAQIESVVPRVCPMVRNQGAKQHSSQFLFEQFLGGNVGSMPMALVYENQVLAARASGQLGPDRVVLFPSPTVRSEYTLVPLHPGAAGLEDTLRSDPVLARRAADLGFRPADPAIRPPGAGPLPSVLVPAPSFRTLQDLRAAVIERCS